MDNQQSLLKIIATENQSYVGKQIIINGLFMGYSESECSFPENLCNQPVNSRSDWIFSDGEWCVYVTGRTPHSFNPMTTKKVPAELSAFVLVNNENKIYLQLISIRQNSNNKTNKYEK